jgi:histidinol dehydrogenase
MSPSLELVSVRKVQMRRLDLRGVVLDSVSVNESIPRAVQSIAQVGTDVQPIIDAVALSGESALLELAQKFDGVDPRPFKVSQDELDEALQSLDADLRNAIEIAIERVRKVSAANKPAEVVTPLADGAKVTQRFVPVDSVGLYVPGGKAVYPSSVIMNVVPALVAGVPRLVICTPPQKDFGGRPHPSVLATAAMLGVADVYAIGGPAAIAAMAHGVPSIELEPVRLVTGPGNNYVTAAKRALRGLVGIDSEAGATEIMILADGSANPEFIAADLISQAEHDESAAAVLVTDSEALIDGVVAALEAQVRQTHHRARVEASLGAQQSALVLVSSLDEAVRVANEYATEHLEIHTVNPHEVAKQITNAGAIFLGGYSPVSLGDYMAGSNHVLPTSGQAKFSSGLGVHTFMRAQQLIDYSPSGLATIAPEIDRFAKAEGLPAHGDAVVIRGE